MRNIIVVAGLLLSCQAATAQVQKKIPDSKIEKVTVFLEGAQVERSAKVTLPAAGKYELVFMGISPALDEKSIQAKAEGNVVVMAVSQQRNYIYEQTKLEEVKQTEQLRDALVEKIEWQKNLLLVYKQEQTLLEKNQQVSGTANGLRVADLKEAADFQRNRLTELFQKQMETDRLVKKLEADLRKVKQQLGELNVKAEIPTSEIYVTVTVKEPVTSNFTLQYLVKKAGWFPAYDIRVKDIVSPMKLQYKANVFQQSGEDWKDVKLFLCTGNPNENGDKPTIPAWYLRYGFIAAPKPTAVVTTYGNFTVNGTVINDKGEALPGISARLKGTRTGTACDNNGQFRLMARPGDVLIFSGAGVETAEYTVSNSPTMQVVLRPMVLTGTEVVVTSLGSADRDFWGNWNGRSDDGKKKNTERSRESNALETQTSYQPTTTTYEIKDPYTVLNDGKNYMVDIDGFELKVDYEYYTAPKLDPAVYLTAKITDWEELNLLPGEANLFFEGAYLGKTNLNLDNTGDTLNVSLGKDRGVVVKRTLLKEYSNKKFIGSNRTDTRKFEIAVRNNKQLPVTIVVEDQFPISTQKEIEVQDRSYAGAKLDDDTQRLTWQLTVESKKETKLGFAYEVKYPKEKILKLD